MKRKGSITVLAALSIMLVGNLLLAIFEAARLIEVKKITKASTDLAIESLFACYEPTIWEEYHLLLWEAGESSLANSRERVEMLQTLIDDSLYANGDNSGSLLQSQVSSIDLYKNTYITDQDGVAFEAAAAAFMGNRISFGLYGEISDLGDYIESIEEDERSPEGEMSNARALLRESEESECESLDSVESIKAKGVLASVLPEEKEVSGAKINREYALENSELIDGDGEPIETNWLHSLSTDTYYASFLSSYIKPIETHALQYEQEYLIAGKGSDEENLKAVVTRLIALRELINFEYIITDKTMVAEAEVVALGLSLISLHPELLEPIKYGILAGWAYAESILDLRALMKGKKIPLTKNSASWTSKLSNLPSLLFGEAETKEDESGVSYEMYLEAFLLLEGTKKKAFRTLDAIEATVRQKEERPDFHIEDMVLEGSIEVIYKYHSILWDKLFYVINSSSYSYRKAGV